MPNTPKYVRLNDELYLGIVMDQESGWSISGLDVKPYPDEDVDPEAAKFVNTSLRRGVLEPASEAEYNHLQKTHSALASLVDPGPGGESAGPWNEPALLATARTARRELVRLRNEDHARRGGFTDTDEDGEAADDLDSYTATKLREEAKTLGLETSGNRAELIAAIREARAGA